jgi:hypothetical protein
MYDTSTSTPVASRTPAVRLGAMRLGAIALATSVLLLLCLGPATVSAEPGRGADPTGSLPLETWTILANGYEGVLDIDAIGAGGNFSGSVFGTPMKGFYDGISRRITFSTTTAPSSELQVFRGHQLTLGFAQDWGLAGEFEAFSGTGATATRNVYGWRAIPNFMYPKTQKAVYGSDVYTLLSPTKLSIDANGFIGTLNIAAVDALGNVTGTVFGDGIQGFWDGHQRKLTFIRFEDLNDASHLQIYTGYLTPGYSPGFAGSFEAFIGATAQRNVFGWYANPSIVPMLTPSPKEILR